MNEKYINLLSIIAISIIFLYYRQQYKNEKKSIDSEFDIQFQNYGQMIDFILVKIDRKFPVGFPMNTYFKNLVNHIIRSTERANPHLIKEGDIKIIYDDYGLHLIDENFNKQYKKYKEDLIKNKRS
jgi:hypothetical protein